MYAVFLKIFWDQRRTLKTNRHYHINNTTHKKSITPWSPATRHPPAASILKVSLIAVRYMVVLNCLNMAIYFLIEN